MATQFPSHDREGEAVPLDLPMLNEKGADTAWEDEEGNRVTLQDILDMTKNVPQKDYPTEKLAKVVLDWDDNPEEVERIEQVEVSKQYPILIMVDEAGKIQWILDGNHRAQKALRSKAETIPAKLIKPSMLDAKAKKVLLGGLKAKIRNPKARKAFAARHRCKTANDRTTARYWSCRLPRYASMLGLGANMNTFW